MLQHSQWPDCPGCLLRGGLTLTPTGLPPLSRRQLSGHTSELLGSNLSREYQLHAGICSEYDQTVPCSMK